MYGLHKYDMSVFKDTFLQEEQPYDKFKTLGPENLTDAELLAIMLRTGTRGKTPVDLGKDVLQLFGEKWGLLGLHHFSLRDLTKLQGIGEVKAIQLLCIAEISKRISHMQAERKLNFANAKSVADYYMERLRHLEQEQCILVLLDGKNRLISDCMMSLGTVNTTIVSPREIFIRAMKEEAAYIIILHNHPSGDANPSRQDRLMTHRLKEVSELVEIPLLDHIIIGDNQFFSFKQNRLI